MQLRNPHSGVAGNGHGRIAGGQSDNSVRDGAYALSLIARTFIISLTNLIEHTKFNNVYNKGKEGCPVKNPTATNAGYGHSILPQVSCANAQW